MRLVKRAPVKTLLILCLSALLVFSLAWLNHTIHVTEAEIERLWAETVIEGELIQNHYETQDTIGFGVISRYIWDLIYFSGFVVDYYIESSFFNRYSSLLTIGVSDLNELIANNTKTLLDEQLGVICDDMTVEFFDGFDEDDFAFVSSEGDEMAIIPIIIRRELAQNWASYIALDEPFQWGMNEMAMVIGVFDGGLRRGINRWSDDIPLAIVPESYVRTTTGRWPFWGIGTIQTYYPPLLTARFNIDPARNREIQDFRNMIEPFLDENNVGMLGTVSLILFMDDGVLFDVIVPMEQNLSLLRILYPIVIAVSFALTVGLMLLLMMQNAKNAAIMRVLGAKKATTQRAVCIEQLGVCTVGVVLGLLAVIIFAGTVGSVPFILAGLYLAGAFIGSTAGAVIISVRSPLELLQVRE